MSKTPFDFSKDIMHKKEGVMHNDTDENEYVPFVVNRVLSLYPDTIFHAQDMNMVPHIENRLQYDYLFQSIRKSYRPFIAYPKAKNNEHMSLIIEFYKYSPKKAREALAILTDEQLATIKKRYEKGG